MLEGQDRRLYSYDVKILWGGALLLDDEILEWLDNTIRSPMPPLDIVRYGDLEVSGDELDEKFLSAGEDAMVFDGVRETVAVDGDGTAVWLGSSSSVALPAGEWEIHRVDMSGAYRESEPLKLRLTDSVACRLDIRPGWNLLAIPWAMQELAWNQEQLLREQCNGQLFTVEGNSYVAYDGPLAAGCAYWVHAEKKGVITLYGTMDDVDLDDRINMGLPEGDTWYFGTDPGADWRTDGLVWNGRRFVPAKATTDGLAGWWYIRR
jgi:hypothetical protein